MSKGKAAHVVFVLFTLILGFILSVAPLPDFLYGSRPLWLALILAYWAFELPYDFKISMAWLVGLAQDALYGTAFGMHALFFAFVVYAVLTLQQRLRMFPHWQQALFITIILMLGQVVFLWLHQLTGAKPLLVQYVFPALISGLLWPWLYSLLRVLHRGLLR